MVEYRALGALDVVVGGDRADLGGPRQRRLLAVLLVHRGSVVSTDALVDAVFAGAPTPRAAATLRSYVTRLRRAIGPDGRDALHRDGSGYRLAVADDGFDVARFESLARRGRRELVYGDAAAAVATARQALGLWRGRAYEEFADEPWVQPEARRLEELRLVVTEHLVDAELECGRAAEMVAELERLVDAEPFREVFRGRLMLALYRSGRASDALAVYREHRRRLADELGLDPSPELAELQDRILAHDASLRQPEPSGRPLRGYRLGERLGRGRLGVVHAARLVGATRDLVIRLYPAETADDPVFVRRFEADARRLASLDHPGVVAVLDAWREPGAAALVMRRMSGGTLRDRLDVAGPLSRADATPLFERVGGALVAAERRGLSHRNLRPTSVFFDADGAAHLSDFVLGAGDDGHAADAVGFVQLVTDSCDVDLPPSLLDPAVDTPIDAVVDGMLAGLRGERRRASAPDNPYVGLRAFDESDADRFYGREALVDDLVARLSTRGVGHRLVLVVGGSGSGKSSAVRAGVIPRLRGDDRGGAWTVTVMLPGSAPFKELAEALRRVSVDDVPALADELRTQPERLAAAVDAIVPDDGDLLLVVDQFDELFSLGSSDDRDRFLDAIAHAVRLPEGRLSVLATLRADYFDRPLDHARFAAVVHGATVTVPAMTAAEIEGAITGPADRLEVERGLTAQLVSSVLDQPAALPALQFTLYELATRGGDRLTRDDLTALGGVAGAITTRAEHLYSQLADDEQRVVRRLFERLVAVEATGEPARRRAARAELVGVGDHAVVDRLIETWVQARLLTSDRDPETRQPMVEVAHEAVLQRWPRLREWIAADRDWLRALAQLQQAAATWHDVDRDGGALLRGARLERALELTGGRGASVPGAVRDLLDASVAARDADAAREAEAAAAQVRTNQRLRRQRILLAGALALSVLVGAFAIERQGAASRNAAESARNAAAADARARAATAGLVAASDEALASDWRLALLLAVEAYQLDDSPATRRGLLTALTNPRPIPTAVHTDTSGFQTVATDDEHGLVVANEPLGPIHVIDRATGQAVGGPLSAPAPFRVGGLDLAGPLVAAGGLTADGVNAVVYDLGSRRQVHQVPGRVDELADVAFSPDGRSLAVTGVGRIRVFDTRDWRRTATLTTGDGEQVIAVAWGADGAVLYGGGFEGSVWSWDLDRVRDDAATPPARSVALAVEPEPTPVTTIEPIAELGMLAVAPFDPALYLLDDGDLRVVEGPLVHDNVTFGVAVDEDRDLIAVAAVNRVALWSLRPLPTPDGDVGLEEPPTREDALLASATDAVFEPDGALLTVGLDGDVVTWDLDPPSPAFEPIPDAGFGIPTFSPDGDVFAVWGGGQGVRLLDAETGELRARMAIDRPGSASIAGVAFVPDDERVAAVWCPDVDPRAQQPCRARVAVFDEVSGRAVAGPVDAGVVADWVPGVASVSADRRLLAVGQADGQVVLRDLAMLDVLDRLDDVVRGDQPFVIDTSFSPTAPGLLTASTADDAAVWDLSGAEPELIVTGRTGLTNRFTPDGLIVSSDQDGSLEVREPATLDVVTGIEGLARPVIAPSFTRDGALMVTTDDLTAQVRLWRTDGFEQFGGPIDALGGTIHPDGSAIVVGGDPALRLPMDPRVWVRAACETAGRDLTRDEWRRYFSDEPYRRTCS